MAEPLIGKTLPELRQIAQDSGLPAFAGNQMALWLYSKRVRSIDSMTNISKAGRERLSENYEVGVREPIGVATSSDGTKKYLFPVRDNPSEAVEAVMIPDGDRKTLCVSSQAGCRMGCKFCMTGRQGFHGNLAPADILSQFLAVDEADSLTGAVFMGMGEPLDNWEALLPVLEVLTSGWGFGWSPKRVTVSTVGIIPNLRKFLDGSRCHLAISLHNPFPDERLSMMPVEKIHSIEEVLALIRGYDFTGQRRVSFEYTMFAGFNDTPLHAKALLNLLHGLECRVNLIRFHSIPGFPCVSSSQDVMESFRDTLTKGGVTATIRASRGEDILAACGLLAGQHKLQQ